MISYIASKFGAFIFKKIFKFVMCSLRLCTRGRQRGYIILATMITLGILPYLSISRKPLCLQETQRIVENRSKEYCLHEKGKGCERPKLDPFAPEIMAMTEDLPKIACSGLDWVICKVRRIGTFRPKIFTSASSFNRVKSRVTT
ncbi:unnamed protein product [Spodoptera littoralis]|uniref:Uncharacterized protein n=1 Tax=Spodoptera littoralis TaxID=7109 RepID=A0A9P0IEK8_SPOLI|nr:unnamed protein product [Spodoptera littoralis]